MASVVACPEGIVGNASKCLLILAILLARSTAITTSSASSLGACYPDGSIFGSSSYSCTAATYCTNQNGAMQLGSMTLASCN